MKHLYALAIDRFGKNGLVDLRFAVFVTAEQNLEAESKALKKLEEESPNAVFEITQAHRVCVTADDVYTQFCRI